MVLWKSFLSLQNFWLKNAKIIFLKKIGVLMQFFFQIEVQVILNPSSRLEKHQTPEFLVINDFYDFFYES